MNTRRGARNPGFASIGPILALLFLVALGALQAPAAEDAVSDSLARILHKLSGRERIAALHELARHLRSSDPSACVAAAREALALARELQLEEPEVHSLRLLGGGYYKSGLEDSALAYFEEGLELSRRIGFLKGQADLLGNIGLIFDHRQAHEQALGHLESALAIYGELADSSGLARTLHSLGNTCWHLAEYHDAHDYYGKALDVHRLRGNREREASTLNNLGNVELRLGRADRALERYLASLRIREGLGGDSKLAHSLSNLGSFFLMRDQFERAGEYIGRALEIYRKLGDRKREVSALANLGVIQRELGEYEAATAAQEEVLALQRELRNRPGEATALNNLGSALCYLDQPDRALECYAQALSIRRSLDDRQGIVDVRNNLGSLLHDLGRSAEALPHLENALALAREIGDKEGAATGLEMLRVIHSARGDYRRAYDFAQQLHVLQDSLNSLELRKTVTELELRFDTERKERAIELLEADAEIRELKLRGHRRTLGLLSAILGLVLLLILFLVQRQRRERRINRLLSQQQIELEASRSELALLNRDLECRVEEEVRTRREQEEKAILQARLASLGELAAGIAHEINQPLQSIAFSLDNVSLAVSEGRAERPYLQSKLELLFSDIDRMQHIIDHIRNFSRRQSPERHEPFDVNECLRNALGMVGQQYRNHGIIVEEALAEGLRPVEGNIFRFEQVVLNLLSNARDAVEDRARKMDGESGEGGSAVSHEPRIRLESRRENDRILVAVEDNGVGIPGDQLENLFLPFFTTKDPGKGTGLGLSISFGIVKEMGGEINVDSEAGRGTRVTVALPVAGKGVR